MQNVNRSETDFRVIQRPGAGYTLVPLNDRARKYLNDRRSNGFSRLGLTRLLRDGWKVS